MNDKGFKVAAFNRTTSKVKDFAENEAYGTEIRCCMDLETFMKSLKSPKRVMLMVKAGQPVDDFIGLLKPFLRDGDIIIDGGNSLYSDTERRCRALEADGLCFVGCGVSGGEEGARHGPSLMPGGTAAAWSHLQAIFQAIAARASLTTADGSVKEVICCQWLGPGGSGHFVKMVHNGIEYADMQTICEGYELLRSGIRMPASAASETFRQWRSTDLDGFLLEIAEQILSFRDPSDNDTFLVDKIRDAAGQKGTGKWTVIAGLESGVPASLFSEAVFSRSLSALKDLRVTASRTLPCSAVSSPDSWACASKDQPLEEIRRALYCAKIMAYAQGFSLIQSISCSSGWALNFSGICETWMGGCIIRSKLLEKIHAAFASNGNSESEPFLYYPYFIDLLGSEYQPAWRRVVSRAVLSGISVGSLSTALSYYDALRAASSPANLLQAMRDFFGAHTYELLDAPGEFHHTNWTGRGGHVSSTVYDA